jgi:hypothetical protein
MRTLGVIGAVAVAAAGLSGCSGAVPPGDAGVCYQVIYKHGQPSRYVKVADHVASLEECAARLEIIRISFLRMGGSIHEIDGAFTDQFLFIDASGVYAAKSLNSPRYLLMHRTADGRLVRPGYINTTPVPQ